MRIYDPAKHPCEDCKREKCGETTCLRWRIWFRHAWRDTVAPFLKLSEEITKQKERKQNDENQT